MDDVAQKLHFTEITQINRKELNTEMRKGLCTLLEAKGRVGVIIQERLQL